MSNINGEPCDDCKCDDSGGGGTVAETPVWGELSTSTTILTKTFPDNNYQGFFELTNGGEEDMVLIIDPIAPNGFEIIHTGNYQFTIDISFQNQALGGGIRQYGIVAFIDDVQQPNPELVSVSSDDSTSLTYTGISYLTAETKVNIQMAQLDGTLTTIELERVNMALVKLGGVAGDAGPIGPVGIQGNDGAIGPTGDIGPIGPTGDTGPTGLVGQKGGTGDIGPRGIQGNDGKQGEQGIQGIQGIPGVEGPTGPQGEPGVPAGTQWLGQWEGNSTYYKDDMVIEDGYLMIANKATVEYPSPQPIGDPRYIYTADNLISDVYSTKQIINGMRYTFTQTGYFQGYRVFCVIGNKYSVNLIKDPISNPTIHPLITFVASIAGWCDFNLSGLITANSVFEISVVISEPDPTPITVTEPWVYSTGNDLPTSNGQMIQSNQDRSILRINRADADAVLQNTLLGNLSAGDIISTPEIQWSLQASGVPIDNYWEFKISPATQKTVLGRQDFDFETTTATNITYQRDIAGAVTGSEGFISLDGDTAGLIYNNDQFGVDILVQDASIPTDWDFMSYSGSAGDSGTSLQGAYNNSQPPLIQLTEDKQQVIFRNKDTGNAVVDIQSNDGKLAIALKSDRLVVRDPTISLLQLENEGTVVSDVNGKIVFGLEPFASPIAGDIKCNDTKLKFGILNVDRVELSEDALYSTTDGEMDIGTPTNRFKQGFFTDTVAGADAVLDNEFITFQQNKTFSFKYLKNSEQIVGYQTNAKVVAFTNADSYDNGSGQAWNFFTATGEAEILRGGLYHISYSIPFTASTSPNGTRVSQIRINQGSSGIPTGQQNAGRVESFQQQNQEGCQSASIIYRLEAGQTVNLEVYSPLGTPGNFPISGTQEYQIVTFEMTSISLDPIITP